ncbi:hypothetical protein AVEN_132699-1 [Araneus ventricosus]|uniref:Uncharacterized protein n=1 Tax=Araneus ventricosus TaxID=182803 RepID=A0A4Y2AUW3_ARAVE|nr:hypothetical protein AVEN_132699-1 [Araneus ventricosus]
MNRMDCSKKEWKWNRLVSGIQNSLSALFTVSHIWELHPFPSQFRTDNQEAGRQSHPSQEKIFAEICAMLHEEMQAEMLFIHPYCLLEKKNQR